MITLWHGSRTGLNGPIRPISSTNEHNEYIPHDFGVGFYAGNKLGSAVNWVSCNVLNQHSEITTYKLSEFLRTDPRYKNRTLQQISNDFIKLEARMRNDVTMIKRKYKSSSNDKLINELLSEKEDKLRESMIEIDNPSDLDPRELGR